MSSYRYDVVEELGREESAKSFTDAQEAGRAFYNADVSKRPHVIEIQGNSGRIMASTKQAGSLQNPDFYKGVPLGDNNGRDHEFLSGYYAEMEKAVFGELGKVGSLEKLSPKSRKELEFLYLNNPIKTVSAWEQKASPAVSRPAYFGKTVKEILEEKRMAELMESAQRQKEELAESLGKSPEEKKQGENVVETQNALPETFLKRSVIPEGVKKRYLQVGNRFYFEKNPDQLAFEDKGNKLHTKSNGVTVAAALVEIANSRGWTEIKVKGSEEFRRAVWLKANVQGIECRGYEPKETDLATLEKLSLQKALWEKKPEELVKEYPGLSNEAVTLKLAEKVSRRFPNKTDQKRFMAGVVDRVASQVDQGQPLPQVRIREPKRGREKLVQER
jgi:hypothetical protein